MKKYNYSKLVFCLQLLLMIFAISLILFLVYIIEKDIFISCTVFSVLFTSYWIHRNKNLWLKRSVVIKSETILFNSFFIVAPEKASSYEIKYSDITNITAVWIPIVGMCGVKIWSKDYTLPFKVNFCFKNHKDFYIEICKTAKRKNIYIDSRLQKYFDRMETADSD